MRRSFEGDMQKRLAATSELRLQVEATCGGLTTQLAGTAEELRAERRELARQRQRALYFQNEVRAVCTGESVAGRERTAQGGGAGWGQAGNAAAPPPPTRVRGLCSKAMPSA